MTNISTQSRAFRAIASPLAAPILFLLIGMIVIPYAGVQNDEALFAAPSMK